jgi:hypothetical protein
MVLVIAMIKVRVCVTRYRGYHIFFVVIVYSSYVCKSTLQLEPV